MKKFIGIIESDIHVYAEDITDHTLLITLNKLETNFHKKVILTKYYINERLLLRIGYCDVSITLIINLINDIILPTYGYICYTARSSNDFILFKKFNENNTVTVYDHETSQNIKLYFQSLWET